MNWDQIEGQWKDIKGSVREKWAKLTDDDVELIGGKKDRFVGKLQERYGLAKDHAEREVDTYIEGMNKDKSRLS
ncbi:MAG: CsbD family protein [Chitinophagaceae bacterium]|nr:CsbD family protein [Oligoflexus sp.]